VFEYPNSNIEPNITSEINDMINGIPYSHILLLLYIYIYKL
jgi:hypothetical protein